MGGMHLCQPRAALGGNIVEGKIQALHTVVTYKRRCDVEDAFGAKVVARKVNVCEAPVSLQADTQQSTARNFNWSKAAAQIQRCQRL